MNQPIKGRGLNGKRFNPVEALARIAQGGITKAAGITPAEVALIPEITAARLYSAARCGGRSQTTARVLFALENERRVAFEQGRAQAFFKANSNPIVPAEPAAVVDRSPVDYAKLRELVAKVEVSAGSVSLFDALALANAVLVREPLTVSACTRKITYAGTERTVRVVVCPTGVIAVSSLDTTFNLPWDAGLWHVDDNGRSSLKLSLIHI